MKGPLSGLRVIDLSQAAAGPICSMLLGDLGAEVIKIEVGQGDTSRNVAGPSYKGLTYLYISHNRSKKSIVLDLRTKAGKEAFYDLVKISDVVLDNYRPGVLERLGADHETLKKINPRVISCSVSGYGSSGPHRDKPAYDPVIMGLSGLGSLIGEADRPPVIPSLAIADQVTPLYAAIGIVSALVRRQSVGGGQKVEVSLLDTCFSLLAHYATYYFLSGQALGRLGSGHPTIVPFGLFPTKEGYITIGPCWPRIARVVGAEWMVDDPRFVDAEARLKHRAELDAILTGLFLKEKAEDWLELLRVEDIPAGLVNTVDKAVVDPQVIHNEMVLTLPHPQGGEIKMVGNPIKMPGVISGDYLPPPALGQHTEEILSKLLGYSEAKIRQLKEEQDKHAQELEKHTRKVR